MTTAPPTLAAPARRRWLLLIAALALAGAGGGYYLWRRAHRAEMPAVATADMEPAVAAAIEKARAGVEREPESADAWGQVGLVLFANDLYAESLPWLERAERLGAADVRWPYFRGMAMLLLRPEEAVACLERAAELAPRDPAVRLRLAEALLAADKADEAGRAFDAVLRARPEDARALLGRGRVLLLLGDAAGAAPLLEKAAAHPSAQKSARAALVEACQRLGDAKGTEEQRLLATAAPKDTAWSDPKLAAISALQVNLRGRLIRANSILSGGNAEQAIAVLREIVRDWPDAGEAHLALGKALIRGRRVEEAEAPLRKAVELSPELADGYFGLGGIHQMRKDYAAAEDRYRKVVELRPGDALAHYNIGVCRRIRGDAAGAIGSLREAVRYRPGLAPAHRELGELLLEAGSIDDAISSLETATRLEPANDKARALLEQARARKKT